MREFFENLAAHPNHISKGSRYFCPDCEAWGFINMNLGQTMHGGESVVWEREGKQIYVCPKRKSDQAGKQMNLIGVGAPELTSLRWKLEALHATQREYRGAQDKCSHQLHYEDIRRDYQPRLGRLQEELQLSVEALLASSATHKQVGE